MIEQRLIPMVGFGDVRLGMTVRQVTDILGNPDDMNEDVQYGDEDDDVTTELFYEKLGLSLSFDKVENYRLTDIMTEEGCTMGITDTIRIGAALDDVLKAAQEADFGPFVEVDLTEEMDEEEAEELLGRDLHEIDFEECGLSLWFRDGKLDTIQMGPEYDEKDNILWPKK